MARARHPKVAAIGEAGLDYHYDYSSRDAQERGFRDRIAAARETGLPLVIHSREADDEVRKSSKRKREGGLPGRAALLTGGPELARRAIALGLSISFTGIVTFKKSDDLRAIAASLPADRFLVETDAPYLRPENIAASATSRPMWSRPPRCWRRPAAYVDEIARQTTENFFRLFSKVPRPDAATQTIHAICAAMKPA